MTPILKGSVVTITDPESSFNGTQGLLEEDALDARQVVKVRFGKEYSYLFGFDFSNETAVIDIPAICLRQEADFTPENRAKRVFGNNHWHHLYTFKDPFSLAAGHDCQYEPCGNKATQRILVNIWGCICEYETCATCAERWHGKMVDGFPAKQVRKTA